MQKTIKAFARLVMFLAARRADPVGGLPPVGVHQQKAVLTRRVVRGRRTLRVGRQNISESALRHFKQFPLSRAGPEGTGIRNAVVVDRDPFDPQQAVRQIGAADLEHVGVVLEDVFRRERAERGRTNGVVGGRPRRREERRQIGGDAAGAPDRQFGTGEFGVFGQQLMKIAVTAARDDGIGLIPFFYRQSVADQGFIPENEFGYEHRDQKTIKDLVRQGEGQKAAVQQEMNGGEHRREDQRRKLKVCERSVETPQPFQETREEQDQEQYRRAQEQQHLLVFRAGPRLAQKKHDARHENEMEHEDPSGLHGRHGHQKGKRRQQHGDSGRDGDAPDPNPRADEQQSGDRKNAQKGNKDVGRRIIIQINPVDAEESGAEEPPRHRADILRLHGEEFFYRDPRIHPVRIQKRLQPRNDLEQSQRYGEYQAAADRAPLPQQRSDRLLAQKNAASDIKYREQTEHIEVIELKAGKPRGHCDERDRRQFFAAQKQFHEQHQNGEKHDDGQKKIMLSPQQIELGEGPQHTPDQSRFAVGKNQPEIPERNQRQQFVFDEQNIEQPGGKRRRRQHEKQIIERIETREVEGAAVSPERLGDRKLGTGPVVQKVFQHRDILIQSVAPDIGENIYLRAENIFPVEQTKRKQHDIKGNRDVGQHSARDRLSRFAPEQRHGGGEQNESGEKAEIVSVRTGVGEAVPVQMLRPEFQHERLPDPVQTELGVAFPVRQIEGASLQLQDHGPFLLRGLLLHLEADSERTIVRQTAQGEFLSIAEISRRVEEHRLAGSGELFRFLPESRGQEDDPGKAVLFGNKGLAGFVIPRFFRRDQFVARRRDPHAVAPDFAREKTEDPGGDQQGRQPETQPCGDRIPAFQKREHPGVHFPTSFR